MRVTTGPLPRNLAVSDDFDGKLKELRDDGEIGKLEKELHKFQRSLKWWKAILDEDRILESKDERRFTESYGLRTAFKASVERYDRWMNRLARLLWRDGQEDRDYQDILSLQHEQNGLYMSRWLKIQMRRQEAMVSELLWYLEEVGEEWESRLRMSRIQDPTKELMEIVEITALPKTTRNFYEKLIETGNKNIVSKVMVGDKVFYLTQPHRTTSNYAECFMFVLSGDTLYPRLAYKSHSGASWKTSIGRSTHMYQKGHEKGFYEQGNKVCPELEQGLYNLERHWIAEDGSLKSKTLDNDFAIIFFEDDDTRTFTREAEPFTPPGLEKVQSIKASDAFRRRNKHKVNEMLNTWVPDDFVPDFKQIPLKIANRLNDMGENVRLELYEHKYRGQAYHFWMAWDEEGRVWVERITEHPDKITTYGTHARVFDSCLTKKPKQYKDHANKLLQMSPEEAAKYQNPDGTFNGNIAITNVDPDGLYVDITPTLDKCKIIQAFRRDRSIRRRPLTNGTPSFSITSEGQMWGDSTIEKLQNRLEYSNLPLTPEVRALVWELEEGKSLREIQRTFITLLQNPGKYPSITLRALRQLWVDTVEPDDEWAMMGYLQTIVDQFRRGGFPPEPGVYVSMYSSILEVLGARDVEGQFIRKMMTPRRLQMSMMGSFEEGPRDPMTFNLGKWIKKYDVLRKAVSYLES